MSTVLQSSNALFRRKYPRRQFRRKLGVLIEGRYWMGNGVEIGEGGVSFLLGQNLADGKHIVLNFQIPGGGFISVQGEVKNIRKQQASGLYTYGISFRTLKFESKREIRAYVSARQETEN